MKVLLINPPIRRWAKPNCFPTGLGYIASVLLRKGHEIEVMDINAHRWTKEQVEEKIIKAKFDLAGTGGIVTCYRYIKWLLSTIRKHHPKIKIMVGGSVSTSIPRTLLERTEADIAVIGEGEVTVCELVNTLANLGTLEDVKGIWFKREDGSIHRCAPRGVIENLDDIPFPAYELFPVEIYADNPLAAANPNKWIDGAASSTVQRRTGNMSTSRGCPYKCIYCYHDFLGEGYRHRSAENIIGEMEFLNKKYGITYIDFNDDEFLIDSKHVYEFCDELIKSRLNVQWSVAGRVNLVDEELLKKMRSGGCISVQYGIESGSQRMLDAMKKRVTVKQAQEALELTKRYFGFNDCSIMIGMIGETLQTIQETINFCKEVNLIPQAIFFVTAYPGTELYEIARQRGMIKDEEEYVLKLWEQGEVVNTNFTDFMDEELINIKIKMAKELGAPNVVLHQKCEV